MKSQKSNFFEQIRKYEMEKQMLLGELHSHFIVLYGDAKYHYGKIGVIKERMQIYPNSELEEHWKFLIFIESFDRLRLLDDALDHEGEDTIKAFQEFYTEWEKCDFSNIKESMEDAEKLIEIGRNMIDSHESRKTMLEKQISNVAVEMFGKPTDIEKFEGRAGFLQILLTNRPYIYIKDAQEIVKALVRMYDYHMVYMEIFTLQEQYIKELIDIINQEIDEIDKGIESQEKEKEMVEEKQQFSKDDDFEIDTQEEIKRCRNCSRDISNRPAQSKYCSDKCRKRHERILIEKWKTEEKAKKYGKG